MNKKIISDYKRLCGFFDVSSIIEEADRAMAGMLILNGTGAKHVYVGQPPLWKENKYGVGGYTWTISRLDYMVTLCRAFLLTDKKSYLDKIEYDIEDWLNEVPPPPIPYDEDSLNVYNGINNWRMLELGYRMAHTFPVILPVLEQYSNNKTLLDRLYQSVEEHAERIAAGSHLLWPGADHNHYLEEITGLMAAASLIPEHQKSKIWAKQAKDGLERACAAQITESGGQVEGVPSYHNAVIENLCLAVLFADKLKITFSKEFIDRLHKGLDASVHMMNPSGRIAAIGDSEPDYSSVRNTILGFLLFGEYKWIKAAYNLVGRTTILSQAGFYSWGFPRINQLLELLENKCNMDTQIPLFNYQKELGQVYARNSWKADSSYLAFICKSPIHYGSHSHMDQLGFEFHSMGKTLLRDPGRFTYRNDEHRHYYKSSQAHNVPTIDGLDAFEYISTFEYGTQQKGEITAFMDDSRIKGAVGYHDNYSPCRIERSIALVDGEFLLIGDYFHNGKTKTVKTFFQVDSRDVLQKDNNIYSNDKEANIFLYSTYQSANIVDGRLSDRFYHEYPSSRVVYSNVLHSDTEMFFTFAIPFVGTETPKIDNFQVLSNKLYISINQKEYCFEILDDKTFILR